MEQLFLTASRKKYRFQTAKGLLAVEDLWDLDLTSLDLVAKRVNKDLKDSTEESFIARPSTANTELVNKLEILKHIIAIKIEERDKAKNRAAKQAQIQNLKRIAEQKSEEALGAKSQEEILKMIKDLEDETA